MRRLLTALKRAWKLWKETKARIYNVNKDTLSLATLMVNDLVFLVAAFLVWRDPLMWGAALAVMTLNIWNMKRSREGSV